MYRSVSGLIVPVVLLTGITSRPMPSPGMSPVDGQCLIAMPKRYLRCRELTNPKSSGRHSSIMQDGEHYQNYLE